MDTYAALDAQRRADLRFFFAVGFAVGCWTATTAVILWSILT